MTKVLRVLTRVTGVNRVVAHELGKALDATGRHARAGRGRRRDGYTWEMGRACKAPGVKGMGLYLLGRPERSGPAAS